MYSQFALGIGDAQSETHPQPTVLSVYERRKSIKRRVQNQLHDDGGIEAAGVAAAATIATAVSTRKTRD